MWLRDRCADDNTRGGQTGETDRNAQSGAALIAVLAILMLVSVVGLGLALTTSLEPAIASAHEASLSSAYAAEAGLAIAIHELNGIADWNLVLSGQVRSAILQSSTDARLLLPDGTQADVRSLTNVANCGHTAVCTNAELDAFTTDRPWGPNNPRWQVFGHRRLDQFVSTDSAPPPCEVIVWVGDDPAELDGDPLRDSQPAADGTRRPGAGVIVVRAEGFGIRAAHRVVTVTVSRSPAGDQPPQVVAWREIR
ncbi:MAG: pilus assembly PilX N-terminal domain-containing protein [Acidobacteria bacterium]|nr:pilus assembly PilX N-terminal domain-containing protein [Acidobacteriota bacterium]